MSSGMRRPLVQFIHIHHHTTYHRHRTYTVPWAAAERICARTTLVDVQLALHRSDMNFSSCATHREQGLSIQ
jgi:hypothetical protein